jgi:hypothetical protein
MFYENVRLKTPGGKSAWNQPIKGVFSVFESESILPKATRPIEQGKRKVRSSNHNFWGNEKRKEIADTYTCDL